MPAIPPDSNEVRLTPGEALTIYNVEALGVEWRAAWSGDRTVEIDLGAVKTCDSLGVQLLCAAKRTASGQGATVRFTHVPAVVAQAAAAIACEGLFVTNPL